MGLRLLFSVLTRWEWRRKESIDSCDLAEFEDTFRKDDFLPEKRQASLIPGLRNTGTQGEIVFSQELGNDAHDLGSGINWDLVQEKYHRFSWVLFGSIRNRMHQSLLQENPAGFPWNPRFHASQKRN